MRHIHVMSAMLGCAVAIGCGQPRSDHAPASSQGWIPPAYTATPFTGEGFWITAPLPAAEALMRIRKEHGRVAQVVLDRNKSTLQILGRGWEHGIVKWALWLDEDTLGITGDPSVAIDLDGTIWPGESQSLPDLPTGAPWTTSRDPNDDANYLVFTDGAGVARYRVRNYTQLRWSPTSPVVAITYCRGRDLFLFDPDVGTVRNLTENIEGRVEYQSWSPDGRYVVAQILPDDPATSNELRLFRVSDGSSRTLVAMGPDGHAIPERWSPSGERLVVKIALGFGKSCPFPGTVGEVTFEPLDAK